MIARIAGALIAFTVNVAAAFILVRKLSPQEYAFYQILTKRGAWLGSLLNMLLGGWVYRYSAQRVPGSWEAGIATTLLSSLYAYMVGFLLSLYMSPRRLGLALLSGTALSLFIAYSSLRNIVNALRPIRYALLSIIYRLVYTSLVIMLVYLAAYRVVGALASIVVAALTASLLALNWSAKAKPPRDSWQRVLRDWVRHSYAYIPSSIATVLASFDALLVRHSAGEEAVAAFFATLMAFSVINEALATGAGYVTTYLLQGGSIEKAASGLVVLLGTVAPLLVFMALHPLHLVFLINPKYQWASMLVVLHSINVVAGLLESYVFFTASGMIRGEAGESALALTRLSLIGLASRLIYIIVLGILALITLSPLQLLAAWSLLLSASSLLAALGYMRLTPFPSYRLVKRALLLLPVYIIISAPLSYLIPIGAPSPRFLREAATLLLSFTAYALPTYTLIVLITPELRHVIQRAASQLHKWFRSSM